MASCLSGRLLRPLSESLWSQRNQRNRVFFLDTRRVNPHFRRPRHRGWLATPNRLCISHGTDRCDHRLLSHHGTSRNVRISFCKVCSLSNCSFVKVLKFQIICDTCPTCLRSFRSSQWFFLGPSISVRRWWRDAFG